MDGRHNYLAYHGSDRQIFIFPSRTSSLGVHVSEGHRLACDIAITKANDDDPWLHQVSLHVISTLPCDDCEWDEFDEVQATMLKALAKTNNKASDQVSAARTWDDLRLALVMTGGIDALAYTHPASWDGMVGEDRCLVVLRTEAIGVIQIAEAEWIKSGYMPRGEWPSSWYDMPRVSFSSE